MHLLAAKRGRDRRRRRGRRSRPDARRHRRPLGGRHRARLPRRGAGRAAGRRAEPAPRQPAAARAIHLSVDLYVERRRRSAPASSSCACSAARATGPTASSRCAAACRARRHRAAPRCPATTSRIPSCGALDRCGRRACHRLWQYCVAGRRRQRRAASCAYAATPDRPRRSDWREPRPLLRAGLYWPGLPRPTLADLRRHWPAGRARSPPIVFYRALLQGGDLDADRCADRGAARPRASIPLPIFVASLKEPIGAPTARAISAPRPRRRSSSTPPPSRVSQPGAARSDTPLDAPDARCCRWCSPAAPRRPGAPAARPRRRATSP